MGIRRTALVAVACIAAAVACSKKDSTGPGGPGGLPVIGDSAVTIGPENGELTFANGINDSGTVVGVFVDLTPTQYGWLFRDGLLTYLTVNFPSSFDTFPEGVNDSGYVVGYYAAGNSYHSFLNLASVYASFDYPSATNTQAYGINANGVIVGTYFLSGQPNGHAFMKNGATFTNIDPPGAISAAALGINALGDVVGADSDATGQHAYLWIHGAAAPTLLDYAGVTKVLPYAVNDSLVVAGSCFVGSLLTGFVAKGSVVTLIEVPGASTTEAYGINNAGVVVGTYLETSQFGFELATQQ